MSNLPRNLYTAAQIRAIEQAVIHDCGIPGYTLMQRAGEALFWQCDAVLQADSRILVLCGPGNNGGDGYVVAGLLQGEGYDVHVLSLGDPGHLTGDAALARDAWLEKGEINPFGDALPEHVDLVVDAMLGTGLERPLGGNFLEAVQRVNEHAAPVLAVDIPTGLSSETGMPLGAAVQADWTVTFIGLKLGLYSGQGANYRGEVSFDTLQSPPAAYQEISPAAMLVDADDMRRELPPRPADCHKGDFGHVLMIGGNRGMWGSVRMAGEAAGRVGAGLVSVATHPEHADLVSAARPEIMAHGVGGVTDLLPLMEKASVVAIGPGLGQNDWSWSCWGQAIMTNKPLILDADGLNLLAFSPQRRSHWILTPHPGEAARLLGIGTAEVRAARIAVVQEIQQRYGGVVVLKGCGSLIAGPSGVALCAAGNSGMASGGMGDVLTGVIAGLLAQGLVPEAAARVGVLVHARAGDLAAGESPRGLLASDLFPFLRQMVNA